MTTPDERRDATARASEEPTVSTAPAAAPGSPADGASPVPRHGWWAAIPRRLGRARTSTVVLAVLFVAVFALWLNVKPETREARTDDPAEVSGTTEPAQTEPTQPEPTQTEEAEPTEEPATTTPQPTPTTRPTSPTTATSSSPSPDDGTGTATTAPETTAPTPTGGTGEETVPGS
ncbi:hypothetical protein [Blastococcus sp. SYSU DS0533]